jgi:hypothetical protein
VSVFYDFFEQLNSLNVAIFKAKRGDKLFEIDNPVAVFVKHFVHGSNILIFLHIEQPEHNLFELLKR